MDTIFIRSQFIVCACLILSGMTQDTDYETAIFMTIVPDDSSLDLQQIMIFPGSPVDRANGKGFNKSRSLTLTSLSPNSITLLSCDVDYIQGLLFIYDENYGEIRVVRNVDWRTSFTGVTVDTFQDGVSRNKNTKIAVDWISHNVYWTEPLSRWIAVRPAPHPGGNGDNTQYKVVVSDDLDRPYGLAVDPIHGYMFWSDVGLVAKIERASLTGEDRTAIISTGLAEPMSIDVDIGEQRIYWVDGVRDTVESSTFDGGDRKVIRRISNGNFFDIAIYDSILSVTDSWYKTVFFMNKNNGEEVEDEFNTAYGIAIYSADTQPIAKDYCEDSNCSDICVTVGTSAVCLCREGYQMGSDGKTCEVAAGKYHRAVVVCDGQNICLGDIRMVKQNSTEGNYNLSCFYNNSQIPGEDKEIKYMELDMANREVIFATSRAIYAVNVDENNPVRRHITSPDEEITGFALDWTDRNIYLGISTRINVLSQVTMKESTIIHTNIQNPRQLVVSPHDRKLMWISGAGSTSKFEEARMDGANRYTILSLQTAPMSLTYDGYGKRLYWTEPGYIKSCNMTGEDLQTWSDPNMNPDQLVSYKSYMLWTEAVFAKPPVIKIAQFQRTGLDGTGHLLHRIELSSIGAIRNIKILDAAEQPMEIGPCSHLNGWCEQTCIPVGHTGLCGCQYGYVLESDKSSCSSTALTTDFLLVSDSTNNAMYQVSRTDGDVRAVDIEGIGRASGIIVNPNTQSIVWADIEQDLIKTAQLEGSAWSACKVLSNTGAFQSYADMFAIDFSTGNIFYTAVRLDIDTNISFAGIAVLSENGLHRKLVELSAGSEPRGIGVHPAEGKMFWTDLGSTPHIVKANMDGSLVEAIVSQGIVQPNGLAIDYEANVLYFTDGDKDTIQRCTYIGVCDTLYTDAGAHLMDVDMSGQYLYYTAWNRPYVTKINKDDTSDVTYVANNAELGRLDAVSVYTDSTQTQPVHQQCQRNGGHGDCSTFCLPKANGYTCACQDGVALLAGGKICEDASIATTASSEDTVAIAVGVSLGVLLLIAVGIVLTLLYCKRHNHRKRDDQDRTSATFNGLRAYVFGQLHIGPQIEAQRPESIDSTYDMPDDLSAPKLKEAGTKGVERERISIPNTYTNTGVRNTTREDEQLGESNVYHTPNDGDRDTYLQPLEEDGHNHRRRDDRERTSNTSAIFDGARAYVFGQIHFVPQIEAQRPDSTDTTYDRPDDLSAPKMNEAETKGVDRERIALPNTYTNTDFRNTTRADEKPGESNVYHTPNDGDRDTYLQPLEEEDGYIHLN